MQKKRIVLGLIVLALLVMLMSCGGYRQRQKRIKHYLQVNLSMGIWEAFYDDHGGFHGDGSTYGEIRFYGRTADKIRKEIESSDVWEPLSLPEPLDRIVQEYHLGGAVRGTLSERIPIPEEGKGYWCFLDRDDFHNGVGELYNYEALEQMKRHGSFFVPFNFVLAIYDAEHDVIYCYQHDI